MRSSTIGNQAGRPMRSRRPRAATRGLWILLAFATAVFLGAGTPAQAVPLYFNGPGGYGFLATNVTGAGLAPAWAASSSSSWVQVAGPGGTGTISYTEIPLTPTTVNPPQPVPFTAETRWDLTNTTNSPLDVLLAWTTVDRTHYSDVPVAVDSSLFSILDYSNAGTDYLFPAVHLFFAPGGSQSVDVRYTVDGLLPTSGNQLKLPPLRSMAFTSFEPVPEPESLTLLVLGLIGLAGGRRLWR